MRSTKTPAHATNQDFVSSSGCQTETADSNLMVVCEGWVLKKRRKKMQGFARRYFILYQSGRLAYSFEPGQPIRDDISLQHAAISTEPGRKDIHIDSNAATFHIKCLSSEDFEIWMKAFRKFIANGVEARKSASARLASRQGTLRLNRSGTVAEEMGLTISELEASVSDLHLLPLFQTKDSIRKSDRDKHKEHTKFILFKRSHHSTHHELIDDASEGIQHSNAAQVLERVKSIVDTLKSQHLALVKSINTLSQYDPSQGTHAPASPLSYTAEEDEGADKRSARNPAVPARRSDRISIATTVSESIHEWFDALDEGAEGPEEFLIDPQNAPDGGDQPSQILASNHSSVSDRLDNSSIDTDINDDAVKDTTVEGNKALTGVQIVRRTELPAPPAGDEGSLFAILKKNVGKDLANIAFPVTFNEPLTLLQRSAEEVEYYDLLNRAALAVDPIHRICYVAAFAASGYAHTRHRTGRKGFNPMLGETFEDNRMLFIAEKVRHNPLEIAYHAESAGWHLSSTSCGKTKFWGKSLEIIPLGTSRARIGDDQYVWTKPSSFIRNLMVGTKYFEHTGKMTIENTTTKIRCVLDFQQNGYWGPSNVISGAVYGTDGEVLSRLEGKWDDQLSHTLDSSHFHLLWRVHPYPKNSPDYYGFTSFGMALNELTEEMIPILAPTDSRYRPDVRALENGQLNLAEEEKTRIEEMQRDRRRRGEECQPRWFKLVGGEWQYCGGYWEARAQGWKNESFQSLW